jgi:hypothetical protein
MTFIQKTKTPVETGVLNLKIISLNKKLKQTFI